MAATDLGARLQVIAAAALFSTGGAAIKATALDGWQVASFRSGVAVLAVLVMMPGARRRPSAAVLLVGAFYAATLILFVLATKLTTAANAIFLQAAAPIYVVLLGPWLLREPVRRRDLGYLVFLAAGLMLVFAGAVRPQATAPSPWSGNVLGALSGVAWAFALCGLRYLGRLEIGPAAPGRDGRTTGAGGAPGAASAVVFGNLMAFAAALPWAFPVHGATAKDALVVAYLGVVQIGLAYACLTAGLRLVGALPAALLLFVEPVLNPVWAFLAHGERIGPLALCGGGFILAGTFAKTLVDLRRAPAAAIDTPRSVS